ncbi:MAG: peptidoglycan recognition protein family protein [Tepidibacter sp.]|jgi:N-acetyl-anhydromuramyl-L-alanine amidase AmpD|uniref:peptidoglycan recognition protein family protein n=1 Tax=Tepidibacter sp. TaxID=2529387 RepID=UPI0025D17220|nr:peptidoglycan recognition family protein [Tepidibacter sp.]MCT4507352.1 peptidoglycan recognition protein family protein [Tepidibacter sp.]
MNKPNKIIIHHSLTKDSKTVSWEAIKRYHINNQGYRDIGYHWGIELVKNEYKVFKGREEWEVGAHTRGANTNSIGICLVGNFDNSEPPKEQLYKLIVLIKDIYSRYGELPIYTHNHFASYKSCPGRKFPFNWLLDQIKKSNPNNDFASAINKLVSNKIVNSPDYWLNNENYKSEYVRELIKNIANKLN